MARALRPWATLLLAGCAGAPAGVHLARAVPPATDRTRDQRLDESAAAVWAGRLGDAHRALLEVADREVGRADPALDYWSELVALLRCAPVEKAPRASRGLARDWDQLRRLAQIERLRLGVTAGPTTPSAADRPLPVSAPPDGALRWPVEAERWNDEAPAARSIPDHCSAGGVSAASTTTSRDDATATAAVAAEADQAPRVEAMMVRELGAALPAKHPALPALLFEQAALSIAAGDTAGALVALRRLPDPAAGDGGPFTAGDRAQLALAWAVAADANAIGDPAGRPEAVARLRAAVAADLPREARRALTFRLGEQLRGAGLLDEAAAAIGPPPHGDDQLGRYLAFRQMELLVHAGRRAEALAEAREALGRHGREIVDNDAALSSVDDLALRLLVASPFSPETVEVLEALGRPAERLGRMERFAQVAGSVGAYTSAMEAFLWLRQNDADENRQLHHLARASVAAARAGDRGQFARTFALLAGQGEDDEPSEPAGLAPAAAKSARGQTAAKAASPAGLIDSPDAERLYRGRRRDRSLSWQRALLVVARDALPALVDNDDQANLKVLVDRLQRHLTAHGRGPVDAELTTVYRAASAHLRGGARGYAERVGGGRRPILLGDIALDRHHEVTPPEVRLVPRGPRSLLWVPSVGTDPSAARLRRWTAPLGVSLTVAEAQP